MYFFKNLLFYSSISSRQSEYLVMMSMEASTIIVNFMTPWAGVPVVVRGLIWSYSGNKLYLKIFFSTPVHLPDKLSVGLYRTGIFLYRT